MGSYGMQKTKLLGHAVLSQTAHAERNVPRCAAADGAGRVG